MNTGPWVLDLFPEAPAPAPVPVERKRRRTLAVPPRVAAPLVAAAEPAALATPALGDPEALALLRRHQEAGDTVIIVTATNEFVTRPIADAFGVEHLLAIELERDATPGGSGWYTGAIKGVPSFREGKVTRMAQWLGTQGLDWDSVYSTFYSDSINDVPLMERADVPVATNPDPRLRELARERGWRILDLFS